MSKKKFIRAMSHLDDRILERYVRVEDSYVRRPHSSGWVRWTALAACIALVLLALPYTVVLSMENLGFGCL